MTLSVVEPALKVVFKTPLAEPIYEVHQKKKTCPKRFASFFRRHARS